MSVLIARTKGECSQWTGVVVLVDVLCTSTTACALLHNRKPAVLFCKEPSVAENLAKRAGDVFSKTKLSVSYQSNSPFLASKSGTGGKAAVLLADETFNDILWRTRQAKRVFLGGFCNFHALTDLLREQTEDVLLVPIAAFNSPDEVEDGFCTQALRDQLQFAGSPEQAVDDYNNSMRPMEFERAVPKTAAKDSKLAFGIDSLPVVPRLVFTTDEYLVGFNEKGQAPAEWLGEQGVANLAAQNEDSVEETLAKTCHIDLQLMEQMDVGGGQESDPFKIPGVEEPKPENTSSAADVLKGFFKKMATRAKKLEQTVEKTAKEVAAKHNEQTSEPEAAPKETEPVRAPEPKETLSISKPETEEKITEQESVRTSSVSLSQSAQTDIEEVFSEKEEQPEEKTVEAEVKLSANESLSVQPQEPVVTPAAPVAPITKNDQTGKKAVVLFSGGLDSTTCLYWAIAEGYECEALTIQYGQRHDREVISAQMIARKLGIKQHIITLDLPWLKTSSLVDKSKEIPDVPVEQIASQEIPSTYVPGRNLVFLSLAGSLLDSIGANAIIAGPNAVDFSGYPDCTPAFFKAAEQALNRGTARGVREGIEVIAPLMRLSKAEIVKMAAKLQVPFDLTWSCYSGGIKPCGHCDSCKLRAKGFAEAGVRDTSLD